MPIKTHLKSSWNFIDISMEIQRKSNFNFNWIWKKTQWKSSWYLNGIYWKFSEMKYRWKSIRNPVETSMNFQGKAIGNKVDIQQKFKQNAYKNPWENQLKFQLISNGNCNDIPLLSIGNQFGISLKYLWKSFGNLVETSMILMEINRKSSWKFNWNFN